MIVMAGQSDRPRRGAGSSARSPPPARCRRRLASGLVVLSVQTALLRRPVGAALELAAIAAVVGGDAGRDVWLVRFGLLVLSPHFSCSGCRSTGASTGAPRRRRRCSAPPRLLPIAAAGHAAPSSRAPCAAIALDALHEVRPACGSAALVPAGAPAAGRRDQRGLGRPALRPFSPAAPSRAWRSAPSPSSRDRRAARHRPRRQRRRARGNEITAGGCSRRLQLLAARPPAGDGEPLRAARPARRRPARPSVARRCAGCPGSLSPRRAWRCNPRCVVAALGRHAARAPTTRRCGRSRSASPPRRSRGVRRANACPDRKPDRRARPGGAGRRRGVFGAACCRSARWGSSPSAREPASRFSPRHRRLSDDLPASLDPVSGRVGRLRRRALPREVRRCHGARGAGDGPAGLNLPGRPPICGLPTRLSTPRAISTGGSRTGSRRRGCPGSARGSARISAGTDQLPARAVAGYGGARMGTASCRRRWLVAPDSRSPWGRRHRAR